MRRLIVVAALVVAPISLSAQVRTGALVQRLDFADPVAVGVEGAELRAFPFEVGYSPVPGLSLVLRGAVAEGRVLPAEGEALVLSGLTDAHAVVSLERAFARISVSALLPTRSASLRPAEMAVAGMMSQELLPFAVRRWSTGGGLGVDARIARRVGGTELSLSAGYSTSTAYEPEVGDPTYLLPGAQLRGRLGLSTEVGDAAVASLLVGVQRFEPDVYADSSALQPGVRLEVFASYTLPVGARESLSLLASAYRRGATLVTGEGGRGAPIGLGIPLTPRLPGTTASAARELVAVGAEMRVDRGRVVWMPEVDFRFLRGLDGLGQGWLGGVRGAVEYRVAGGTRGRRVTLIPTVGLAVGRALIAREMSSGMTLLHLGIEARVSWAG